MILGVTQLRGNDATHPFRPRLMAAPPANLRYLRTTSHDRDFGEGT